MRRTCVSIFCLLLLIVTAIGCSKEKDEWFQTNDQAPPYNLLNLFDNYPSINEAINGLNTQRLNNGLARMMELGTDVPDFLRIAAELVEAPFLVPTINELSELLGVLQNEAPAQYDYPGVDHGGFYEEERGLLTMAQRTDGFYSALDVVINNTELGGDVLNIAEQVVNYLVSEKTPAEIEDTMASMTGVKVYQHCMYDDSGYAVVLRAGNYTTSQLNTLGIVDNDISSLEVPIGMKVTLYDADNLTGNSIIIDGSDRCLTDNALLAGNWNDKTSSVKVEYDISKLAKLLGKMTMSCDYPMWVNSSHVPAVNRDNAGSGSYTTNTDLGNAVQGVVGLIYGLNSIAAANPDVRDTINAIIQTDLPALMDATDSADMETLIQNLAEHFAPDEIGSNTYETDASYNSSSPYVNAEFKETMRDIFPNIVKLFIRDDGSGANDSVYAISKNSDGYSPIEALTVTLGKLKDVGIDYSDPACALEPSLKRMVEYNGFGTTRAGQTDYRKVSFLDHLTYTIAGAYNFGFLTRNSCSGEPYANSFTASGGSGSWGHGTATRGILTMNDSLYSMTTYGKAVKVLGITITTLDSYGLALAHRTTQGGHVWRRSSSTTGFTYNDANKNNYRFYMGYDYPPLLLLPESCAGDAGIPNGGQLAQPSTPPNSDATTPSTVGSPNRNDYRTYYPKTADGKGMMNTSAWVMSWIARACWDGAGPYYSTAGLTTSTFEWPGKGTRDVNVCYKPNGEVYAYVYITSTPWEYYYPTSATTGIGNDVADPDTNTNGQRFNRYRDICKSDYFMVEDGDEGGMSLSSHESKQHNYVDATSGANKFRLNSGNNPAQCFWLYEKVQELTNTNISVGDDPYQVIGNINRECATQEEAIYRNFQWLMLEKKFMFPIPMNIATTIAGCVQIDCPHCLNRGQRDRRTDQREEKHDGLAYLEHSQQRGNRNSYQLSHGTKKSY